MLQFHQIVLKKFLTLFFILILIVGGIVYYWSYEFYINSTKKALTQDIELLSLAINKDTDLDRLANDVKKRLHLRLTIIDDEGNIIAESHRDKNKMENHKYRAEIMQARKDGSGFEMRYSRTLHKELLYVVKKFPYNNKTIYIRLSQEIKGIQNNILSLGIKILAVIIVFFIFVVIASYKIHKELEYETNKIVEFLKSLTKKKKSTFIRSEYSQEFAHITNLLTKISQILVKKEKQKSKYTQRLKEANQQKDDIISAISHEFKNPIAIVNGYSQTLLEDEDINPNIRTKFLKKIHSNGEKLSNLIDTLRLSMKLDGGQQIIRTQEVNIYELAKECAANLELTYPERTVIVEGDKSAMQKVDKTLFGIVLNNLIENALKYSEDEVHVIVSKESISVADSGIGIAPKDLQNITEKFYRVHQQKWNNSLGLGLFLVNKIISLHNFSLIIKSKVNEGSVFTVKF